MAFCIKCGSEVTEGASFCSNCGHPVQDSQANMSKENMNVVGDEGSLANTKIYTILGVISLPLVLLFNWEAPTVATKVLGILTLALAIFVLVKKCRLKVFPIITIIIEVLCLSGMLYYAIQNTNSQDDSSRTYNAETERVSSTVDPDLKKFLDSYEDFVDEYIEFMEKYKENPSDLSILSEYTEMLDTYADFAKKVNDYNTNSMSEADYNYYIDVTTRCSKKLINIAY